MRRLLPFLFLLFAPTLTIHATSDQAVVMPGGIVTITMSVSSPNGAHIELLKSDVYAFVSGGIDHGVCGSSGCLASPGTAVMTETIRITDDTPAGMLTLTALASAADGSYVTATVQLEFAPVLHLEADASRAELVRGDTFTIDAYLFNDGAKATEEEITILAPPGFELVRSEEAEPTIEAGQATHARFVYLVLPTAPHARARFVVSGGGQAADVVARVGPIEWPPPWRRVWLAVVRG